MLYIVTNGPVSPEAHKKLITVFPLLATHWHNVAHVRTAEHRAIGTKNAAQTFWSTDGEEKCQHVKNRIVNQAGRSEPTVPWKLLSKEATRWARDDVGNPTTLAIIMLLV